MLSLIRHLADYLSISNWFSTVSILCLLLSGFFYQRNMFKLSFFLAYMTLTFGYFFIIAAAGHYTITATYSYHVSLFFCYHFYFTFSKNFLIKTKSIAKKYLKSSEYLKLFLWFVFIFLTSLFGETFVFLMAFNPLLSYSLITDNFAVFSFLLTLWLWLLFLIFCKESQVCDKFLSDIQNYFSAKACTLFMGHRLGDPLREKIGVFLVVVTTVIGVCDITGYILTREHKIAQYAIEKMFDYRGIHPDSTREQLYQIYVTSYIEYRDDLIGLNRWYFIDPAPIEAILPAKK